MFIIALQLLASKALFSFHQKKLFNPSHRMFGHMHGALNVNKKEKLIAQFAWKPQDESFKPN
jgi:hypothetical protein